MDSNTAQQGSTPASPKKKRPATTKEKLAFLWKDKRNWKQRLFNALAVSFAFAYTFFWFQPLEVFFTNSGFFAFSFKYLTPPLILVSLSVFAGLAVILTLLRGKIHNAFVSLTIGILIAGYLQTNLLNIDHGTLDGFEVVWRDYSTQAVLNLLLWVVVILLPFLLHYLVPKIWKYAVRAVSILLVVAQTAALIYLFYTADSGAFYKEGYLSREGIYDVSDQNNVIVFILDRFDNKYADRQLEEDPEVAENLAGFTYYENFVGSYSRTFPSVAYFLTGVRNDYTVTPTEYMKTAWTTSRFLSDIKDAGYDTRFYTEIGYVMGNAAWAQDYVDNAAAHKTKPDSSRILSAMMMLSAYRWTPEALKPYYHFYTDDISYSYIYPDSGDSPDVYSTDDVRFRQDLVEQGLTEKESSGAFIFYHLQGSHDPFYMNSDGERTTFTDVEEGRFEQTNGDLRTVFKYCDMLKELGLYDKTTIIITADHGRTGTLTELADSPVYDDMYGNPDTCERVPALFVKPAGADATQPMQRSQKPLCVDNVRFTIMKALGVSYEGYEHPGYEGDAALAIEDVAEDDQIVRYFWMNGAKRSVRASKRDWNLVTYSISGDANDFDNWEKIDVQRIKYPYYDQRR